MQQLQRILHVEDEPDIRFLVELALRSIGGLKIRSCESASQAQVLAREFTPQLLLLDACLPDTNGVETLDALRLVPGIDLVPVVFMTGMRGADTRQKLWDAGALEVLNKPFDPLTLAQCLHTIWGAHYHALMDSERHPRGRPLSSVYGQG
ncbi:MAG: response regulator [Bradymonadaceae bacterium]